MTAQLTGPLWGVVPAFNEAAGIGATLAALASQSDTCFTLVMVDNASTDATAARVRAFAATAPFAVHLIHEDEPGTGAAVDTGFRYAIARGARWLVRTDTDCLPARNWIAATRAEFARGAEMVCGRSVPRRDEVPSLAERYLLPAVVRTTAVYGRYRTAHRHPRYRAPYVLCHGHNLAMTSDLYLRCGGTPRIPLEGPAEDVVLLNRARERSARIVRAERMVVQASLRRLRAWGARRTLLWCWDRRYCPANLTEVHAR
ncbi:glycosyltransferase [Streptomyces albofaciens JCM 4342]|uniref:glycosyltransferase family A protein n=1 Tax=Streptomyces albofaciens TaxID=66866 RepID=UPI00123C4BFF|nr:glycosyltransferase family 2 protein [Streptomyces albofaciens]KAA6224039.1 glycosyltransferase [Streptomyces albofaciens JCM 4342]